MDRLRANLRAAGIPATDADLESTAAGGYLETVAAVEQVLTACGSDPAPDYLAAWAAPDENNSPVPSTPSVPGTDSTVASPPLPGTIQEIAPRLRNGEISPVELTEQALARMAARDPILNTFQLILAERARAAARRAEQEIQTGDYRGPLHGVPVAVKDLLAMQGTVTTAGSKIFAEHVTDYDAAVVERLEAAGAIIVGKTRLSEFAFWPGSANPHYGPTRNPRSPDHDTGGSSSGSAAAVADGMVYAALGSDTGGSIRIPAALCGLVGLKPTFGRISLYGCAPLSWSLDHLGPLTRSVGDTALLLAVLAGYDERDPRTRPHSDFSLSAEPESGVKGLRIGVLGEDGTGKPLAAPDALAAWQAALHGLEEAGATLVELDLPEMEALRLINAPIISVEALAYHLPMLRARLDDYGEICRNRLIRASAYGPTDLVRAQQVRQAIRRRWMAHFEQVDLLCTPAQPAAAPLLGAGASVAFTNPFNALGWPAISVPAGVNEAGLPLAIQLVAKPWDEATLLAAARAVEVGARADAI
jgi:aspartyl-tRNA(Asn)/glutamyl-tRNA(Gln) amidotransferase subunit A